MLLPKTLLQLPTKEARRAAVKSIVMDAIDGGTFTYTDLLLSDEGLYTVAFEILDGVETNSANVPQSTGVGVYSGGSVRLVSIDTPEKVAADNADKPPEQHRKLATIRTSSWYEPRIPGSSERGKPIKRITDHGTDVMMDDSLDQGRLARTQLLKYGWPVRNIKSRSGSVGTIVEWRWLERAAQAAGEAPEDREVRELYETLKARIEPNKQAKRQSAPATGVGASP